MNAKVKTCFKSQRQIGNKTWKKDKIFKGRIYPICYVNNGKEWQSEKKHPYFFK
jgi:hypothetical protein